MLYEDPSGYHEQPTWSRDQGRLSRDLGGPGLKARLAGSLMSPFMGGVETYGNPSWGNF